MLWLALHAQRFGPVVTEIDYEWPPDIYRDPHITGRIRELPDWEAFEVNGYYPGHYWLNIFRSMPPRRRFFRV